MKPILHCFLSLALLAAPAFSAVNADPPIALANQPIDADLWRQDLATLRERLIAMHPDPFGRVGRERFDREAGRLQASLPRLSREQAIIGFMQLVAMVGDGHTTMPPFA